MIRQKPQIGCDTIQFREPFGEDVPDGRADDILMMEVPDTDTAIGTTTGRGNSRADHKAVPVRCRVQMADGRMAVLYALDTGEAPARNKDQLTSVSTELVLNSAAVRMGEYGTVRELAESELYHWADANEFHLIQYTRPLRLCSTRYAVHLRLENDRIGMEQLVIYTDLGDGLARVDRLWRAVADVHTDHGSTVFDETAAEMVSGHTL
ncbi:hypothetical protein [Agathobaculum desmolans]|uniref:hypothetical protein n=1 Tax=Agathobaculum desmolans TaxID=39484 RepID=UPI0004E205AD|nr:hypothetical protein [Agathobaculum desmolans]